MYNTCVYDHKLAMRKTIQRWDEAIPLGNGICGALLWGNANCLRFSLDRGDVWDERASLDITGEEFTYPNLVKLAREGDIEKITHIFHLNDAPYPSKLPSGRIVFDFGVDENIASELSLAYAEATLRIGSDILVSSYLHATEKVGMIRINQPKDKFVLRLENPEFGIEGINIPEDQIVDTDTDAGVLPNLKRLQYPAPLVVKQKDTRYFVQKVTDGISFGVFLKIRQTGLGTEIAYILSTSNDGVNWLADAQNKVEWAISQGYDALAVTHRAWWDAFWNKSAIKLPDKFFEKNWYLTQYLLGSGSRKGGVPMALQGVWTADEGALPPWKGDYHYDLNVQLTYYSYLKANHLEEGNVLLDYLWNLRTCAREFARSFYKTAGLCMPSTTTLAGSALGGWAMYCFSPTNQLWTCWLFARHYYYTGDENFLREIAYPYISESAECILGLLEEKEGKYYLPISSSPEIHNASLEAFLTPNSNYDLSLMRYIFLTLEDLAVILGKEDAQKWHAVLERLDPLAVNEDGVFLLSPDEALLESHRHFSHLLSIHPLRLLSYDSEESKRIIDATIWKLQELGSGHWVGYSFPCMAELYAVARNGNGAFRQLDIFWKDFCSPNGFHLNGDYRHHGTSWAHYRPFTLEANFCAADALQEMLLLSDKGFVQLFPAVPDEWLEETVSFNTFRAERGLLVSATLEQGEVVSLTLNPGLDTTIRLYIDEKTEKLVKLIGLPIQNDVVEMKLVAGNTYSYQC